MMISTKLNTISRRAFSPFAMSLRKEVEPEEIITVIFQSSKYFKNLQRKKSND